MEKLEAIRRVRELISGLQVAMLTTVNENGELHSQPLAMHDIDDDACIWFFTKKDDKAVICDGRTCKCSVTLEDAKGTRFIAMSGTAEVIDDAEREHALWTPAMRAYFPDGVDAPDLVLVKFCVEKVEYWDSPGSALEHAVEFVKAAMTGHAEWGGTHEHFDVPHEADPVAAG